MKGSQFLVPRGGAMTSRSRTSMASPRSRGLLRARYTLVSSSSLHLRDQPEVRRTGAHGGSNGVPSERAIGAHENQKLKTRNETHRSRETTQQ